MDPSQDFKSLQDKIQAALMATTRTSNQIAAEDLSFQRSSNPAADEQLDDISERLFALASSLLKSATKGTEIKAPELEDADDVDVNWSRIVDVIDDTLLDKANLCLDEYTGLVKRKAAPMEEVGPQPKKSRTFTALDHSMRRANILKPQNTFELKPDNLDTSTWKPILTSKPHALIPLEDSLGTFSNENNTVQYDYTQHFPNSSQSPADECLAENTPTTNEGPAYLDARVPKQNPLMKRWRGMLSIRNADGSFRYKHPYETEIRHLQFPPSVFETKEPIKYLPVETTSATFVDTFAGVLEMLAELKKAKEIAIDTEHHDFRTYTGLLSLMQISTREKDWIVDTLQPWRHKLQVLNEVFADPKIVKVLHGAYMDIIWLQRDCGIYIVGLFDTYEACTSLGYPSRSLAYLLKRFIEFDADKKYQLADWRIRPIPEEMFYYARSDTHYLLYIFDMMRNELVSQSNRSIPEQDLIGQVLERSRETCLRRHEKLVYDAEGRLGSYGWFNMLVKQSSGSFSREQFAVFRAVHKWRDEIARRDDESPLFVLGNPTVFEITRRMPPDRNALRSILDGSSSNLAKQSLNELHKVIEQAKADGANGPTVAEFLRASNAGIGAVAQQVFPHLKTTGGENIADTKELLAEHSQLWGKMPISTRWENSSGPGGNAKVLQFALPWASFVENASVSEPMAQQSATRAAQSAVEGESDQEEEHDTEFTLKKGHKCRAPEREAEDGSEDEGEVSTLSAAEPKSASLSDDEISVNSSTDDEESRKKRRIAKKKERKAQKKAKKQAEREAQKTAHAADGGDAEDGEDEEPFDYSKAKSVLNVPASERKKGGKIFNPYSSLTAEGPKGARRMHGEKPGKSATFKK